MSKIFPFCPTRSEPLVAPAALKKELPTTISQTQFIEQSRQKILHILEENDPRFLLIMGPCSIHDIPAAEEYAKKVKQLSQEVSDVILPVMRVYFEKPRTKMGWKGIMYDPHLDGSNEMNQGIRQTRQLLLRLAELEIPTASEILDPISAHYFGDLISWGSIGARTSSSQIHRHVASGLPFPVGFKNNTDGNVHVAVNGVCAASHPQSYIGIDEEGSAAIIRTAGNANCHIILRGSESGPNYNEENIREALELLDRHQLPCRLIVDCSHGNSQGDPQKQPKVFQSVLTQILNGNTAIRGWILESYLKLGKQSFSETGAAIEPMVSITDACLDWETTEQLVKQAKKKILEKQKEETEAHQLASV